ncbi:ATP-binding protein [Streptomyces sp. NBC_01498]|uniref:ATP-binding protein n=1 Tax=Streptomyces sp. NBC_01498 TaxID=2975870 RepID=UPI002E7C2373|nr:ATP-binding protein [Streptomyces sp. NBC_01498]WTL26761.1 ATP-binding protein [Streptomyces sp. NBC_01498]
MLSEQQSAEKRVPLAKALFNRHPDSVSSAREWVRQQLARTACTGNVVQVCELLVSEVATNCVLHGAGPTYSVAVFPDLSIEIWDVSNELPQPRAADEESLGGRGLALLAALAPGYTVCTDVELGGKTVRFTPKGW